MLIIVIVIIISLVALIGFILNKKEDIKRKDNIENSNVVFVDRSDEIKNSDFCKKFKQKYGIDFVEWSLDRIKTTGNLHEPSLSTTNCILVFFRKNKLIYAAEANDILISEAELSLLNSNKSKELPPLSNEEILLLCKPDGLLYKYSDRYCKLIMEANFEVFDSLLKPIDDIVDIKYLEDIKTTNIRTERVSKLGTAVKEAVFGTAYATADALNKSAGKTFTNDYSCYRVLFNEMKIKQIYIPKSYFEKTDFLKEIKRDLDIKSTRSAISNNNSSKKTKAEKIKELNDLFAEKLISQEDYDEAKSKILAE